MLLHEFRMVRGPVSRTLPLALLHIIGGNDVHADPVDMKLQKGMFRVPLYHTITREIFAHSWENLLHPLFPLHRRRETSENVQISFAANPSTSRERSLRTDFGLNPRRCKYILNLALNRLRESNHLLSLLIAWNDLLGDLLQDYLRRLGQIDLSQLIVSRNFEES